MNHFEDEVLKVIATYKRLKIAMVRDLMRIHYDVTDEEIWLFL